MRTKINQQNAQINFGLIYYWSITPTCFGLSVEAIIREFELLESYKAILTDQYNGFVTLKDFELPDDGFDWGAETCWSDW